MASRERVRVVRDCSKSVERVFAFLAEHENLAKIFPPAKISVLREGTDGTRNGVGSVRILRIGPLPPIEETNTRIVPNELIEYAITRGSPLREHWGRIAFEPRGEGARITYTIGMEAVVPGLAALIARALTIAIKKGLRTVDRLA